MFLLLEMSFLTISLHQLICIDDTTWSAAAVLCPCRHQKYTVYSNVTFRSTLKRFTWARLKITRPTFSYYLFWKLLQNPSSALWYPARTLRQPVSHSEELFSLFLFTPCTCFTSDVPWSWSVGIAHCIPVSFSTQVYKWVLVLSVIHG